MQDRERNRDFWEVPERRYFTIGEVAKICDLKPHVLRYWEQEFTQLRPEKKKGNRRRYNQKDLALVKHIKELLHDKEFTISGAKQQLSTSGLPKGPQAQSNEKTEDKSLLIHSIINDLEDVLEILD